MAGGITAKATVVARNDIGRFIRECEMAAESTVEDAIEEGARLSRAMAPAGSKPDPRTVPLKESITTRMFGRTRGEWGSSARHALAIEKGAVPHAIPANVRFYWDKLGRMWMPPETYLRVTGYPGADPIQHPGNAAQPYLRPAYAQVMANIMSIARKNYPG